MVADPPCDADGGVEASNSLARENAWGVGVVDGLEADHFALVGVVFEEDTLEGGFVVGFEAGEAVAAAGDRVGGAEDDDIALVVLGFHGIADDAGGKCVGVFEVEDADVLVGDAGGVAEIGEFGGVASGDLIDKGDLKWKGGGFEAGSGVDGADEAAEFARLPGSVEGACLPHCRSVLRRGFGACAEDGGEAGDGLLLLVHVLDFLADGGGGSVPARERSEVALFEREGFFEAGEEFVAGRGGSACGFDLREVAAGTADALGELGEGEAGSGASGVKATAELDEGIGGGVVLVHGEAFLGF